MRAFEQIREEIEQALRVNDADALLRCAEEASAVDTPHAESWSYRARGWASFLKGDYTSSLMQHQRALELTEELSDRRGVATVTASIGMVHVRVGDLPAALEHLHHAMGLANDLGDRAIVAQITGNIGVVYLYASNYPDALACLHEAMMMHVESGDDRNLALVTGNIGNVYSATGDHAEALGCFNKALTLYDEIGDRNGVARITHSIAMLYANAGDHVAAMEFNQRALAIRQELGDHRGMMSVMGSILGEHLAMGSDADAQALLATMDAMQIQEPDIRVEREHNRAELYIREGALDKAEGTLQLALNDALEHGLRHAAAETHRRLRDLAYIRNDLHRYVEHNDEYTRITEEITGKETTLKLAMQAKQHEIDAREKEIAKQLAVLHSALPEDVADRVARGEVVNDSFDTAAVLFLDIVGSTSHSSQLDASTVVELLQSIFIAFDAICADHNVMKIKTIGDAYMAVAFPSENHIADIVAAACAMRTQRFFWPHSDEPVMFRIGMHVGPLIAGVIGTARMQYDVWGDTVNTASRMESSSEPGRIHVSEAFVAALRSEGGGRRAENDPSPHPAIPLSLQQRGIIDIKGKGPMTTYWLERSQP